jgi:hypothetical protein
MEGKAYLVGVAANPEFIDVENTTNKVWVRGLDATELDR